MADLTPEALAALLDDFAAAVTEAVEARAVHDGDDEWARMESKKHGVLLRLQPLLRAAEENAVLRADQGDWRKGVDLIRTALVKFAKKDLPTLSCVDINRAVLEVLTDRDAALRERDELRAALQGVATDAKGKPCPEVTGGNLHAVVDETLAAHRDMRAENATLREQRDGLLRSATDLLEAFDEHGPSVMSGDYSWGDALRDIVRRAREGAK